MSTMSEALQHLELPVCAVDEHARITWWNQAAADLFHVEADAALGSEWHTVIRTTRMDGCCALCRTRRFLRSGAPVQPIDVSLSVGAVHPSVTMVPLPVDTRGGIAFLMLVRGATTILDPPQVYQLEDGRIIDRLTTREREILACVVEGLDARSMAEQLGISHATARNYVQRILTKLGVRNKVEAVNVTLTYNLLAN